jgi:subtilisin family serine protease
VDEEPVTSLAVAVLDTGIQADHPELNVDLNRSRSFVPGVSRPNDGRGHGTYIAGLIGALGKSGVRGQAPGASLWAIKVLDDEGTGMDADVIKGLDYLIFNARRVAVANLSLEGRRSPALDAAASAATAAGIVVVVAAGNGGVNSREISPAREPRVLAVASTDDGSGAQGPLGFAKFSNFGDHVALVASGVNVRSTWKGSGYRELSGTSVSAALASGAAMRLILVNGRDLGRDGRLDLRDVELTKLKLVQGAAAPDEGAACGGESGIVEGPDGRLYPVLAKLGL